MCYYNHSLMLSSSKLKSAPAQCLLKNYLQHPKNNHYREWNEALSAVHQIMAWGELSSMQNSTKKCEKVGKEILW